MINAAIESMHLDSGSAQKLSGWLMWATRHLFYRVGRAMVKPIYAQKATTDGHVGPRLLRALKWWRKVLMHSVAEQRPWHEGHQRPCFLFVDAASSPARCAAVLFRDGEIHYTDGAPCPHLLDQLVVRGDTQIMSLVESLAVF